MNQEVKQIIICADDFGMSPAIDTGIIRLAEQGRLGAASCLAQGPYFSADAAALLRTGVQVGLHLNFTEPIGQPGLYLPLSRLIRHAYLRRLNGKAIRTQISVQLDAFEGVAGRQPDFVDGHQHVHQLPQIRDALLETLTQRYGTGPWLRSTRAVGLSGVPVAYRAKAGVIQFLGANRFATQALGLGFRLNARFAGVYDFRGGETGYRALLRAWLRQMGNGDLLMCHPALEVDQADALGEQRAAEFRVLSSDDAACWMQENQIQLGAGVTPAPVTTLY